MRCCSAGAWIGTLLLAAMLWLCRTSSAAELPWPGECRDPRPGATRVLHVHLLRLASRIHVSSEIWPVIGTEGRPQGTTAEWTALLSDVNADGKSDLLLSDRAGSALALAYAEDHRFVIKGSFPVDGEKLSPARGVALPDAYGRCGRFLLPGREGEPYSVLTWNDGIGFERQPLEGVRRGAGDLRVGIFDADTANPFVVEGDGVSRHTSWQYQPGQGWLIHPGMGLPNLFYETFHGIGMLPGFTGLSSFVVSRRNDTFGAVHAVTTLTSMRLPDADGADVDFQPIVGDFDGNGFTDVLRVAPAGRHFRRTDLVLTLPVGFYSTSVTGLGEALADRPIFGAADFDGDGADELLVGDDAGLSVVHLRPEAPDLHGAEAVVNGVPVTLKPDGSFELEVPRDSVARFVIRGEDLVTLPPAIEVAAGIAVPRAAGVYIEDQSAAEDGRVLSLAAPPQSLFVCNGYNVSFTADGPWARRPLCPPDYAAVDTNAGRGPYLSCCRMPVGLLQNERLYWQSSPTCPPDHLLTGAVEHSSGECPACRGGPAYRCTPIDASRFSLRPSESGEYWGERTDQQDAPAVSRLQLQPGVRVAIGRLGRKSWDDGGCTGRTPGSLLVARPSRWCHEMRFASVVPKNSAYFPSSRIFPIRDCREEPDPFDPSLGCQSR